jgi:hypothetical protein
MSMKGGNAVMGGQGWRLSMVKRWRVGTFAVYLLSWFFWISLELLGFGPLEGFGWGRSVRHEACGRRSCA